jgi:ribonucleotide reductase alpha subunit
MWNKEIKNTIIKNNGSVQSLEIPDTLKELYKTAWEISPRVIIDMARDRGCYICQSQSMNVFVEDPNNSKLSSMHMYSWKQGLKTGMYYLRTRPKAKAIQFTIEPKPCVMCSS